MQRRFFPGSKGRPDFEGTVSVGPRMQAWPITMRSRTWIDGLWTCPRSAGRAVEADVVRARIQRIPFTTNVLFHTADILVQRP